MPSDTPSAVSMNGSVARYAREAAEMEAQVMGLATQGQNYEGPVAILGGEPARLLRATTATTTTTTTATIGSRIPRHPPSPEPLPEPSPEAALRHPSSEAPRHRRRRSSGRTPSLLEVRVHGVAVPEWRLSAHVLEEPGGRLLLLERDCCAHTGPFQVVTPAELVLRLEAADGGGRHQVRPCYSLPLPSRA
jgi:hypothetical protein